MKGALFFPSSRATSKELTNLFDFVWPTAHAFLHVRRQIENGSAIETFLQPDLPNANLKKAFVDQDWAAQEREFAKIILIDSIAHFEGWRKEINRCLGLRELKRDPLQFPAEARAHLDTLRPTKPHRIQQSFYPVLRGAHVPSTRLTNLLVAYRNFKEIRNTLMHGGRREWLQEAWLAYKDITAASLGLSVKPECFPPAPGVPIKISLRGVVGFTKVILDLIAALDAELCCSGKAEEYFAREWLKGTGVLQLPTGPNARRQKIVRAVRKLGFPKPGDHGAHNILLQFLSERDLVR